MIRRHHLRSFGQMSVRLFQWAMATIFTLLIVFGAAVMVAILWFNRPDTPNEAALVHQVPPPDSNCFDLPGDNWLCLYEKYGDAHAIREGWRPAPIPTVPGK